MKKLAGALIVAFITLAAMIPVAFAQTGMACDAAGVAKYEFAPTDTVYVIGNGFSTTSDHVWVSAVTDQVWNPDQTVPADISDDGLNDLVPDGAGNIPVTQIWGPPLPIGDYDVVFDGGDLGYPPDGIYLDDIAMFDADFIDDVDPAGFIVRDPGSEPGENPATGGPIVGGEVMLVNKAALLTQQLALPVRLMMSLIL